MCFLATGSSSLHVVLAWRVKVILSHRSAAYLSQGQAQEALADAKKVVEIKCDWPKGYSRVAAAYHHLGQLDAALEAAEKGLGIDPTNAALQAAKSSVQQAKAQQSASAFGSGMGGPMGGLGQVFGPGLRQKIAKHPTLSKHLSDDDFSDMINKLQSGDTSVLEGQGMQDPRLMEVLGFLLGINVDPQAQERAAAAQRADPAAMRAAHEAQAKAEKDRTAADKAARVQAEQRAKQAEEAAAAARRAAETPEERQAREVAEAAQAKKAEGNAHYKQKDFDAALQCYDAALALEPNNITYRLNKAAVFMEQGDLDRCITESRESIEFGRTNKAPFDLLAKAFARIGNALVKQGKLPEAMEAYESSLLENHTDAVHSRLKRVKAQAKQEEEAAYINPELAAAAKAEGNTAFKAGKFRDALDKYTEAVKRDPTNATYWNNRATTKCKLMDFASALTDSEQVSNRTGAAGQFAGQSTLSKPAHALSVFV